MAESLGNLEVIQRRKMVYILLVYLLSGVAGCFILASFPFVGVIVAPAAAFGLAWILTGIVNKTVQVRCPFCDANELKENFVLQCRLPEYQCERCQQRYVGDR